MFDTNKSVNKILGGGYDKSVYPMNYALNQDFNSNYQRQEIVSRIKRIFDAMPEVKQATGNIKITFANGKTINMNLSYR